MSDIQSAAWTVVTDTTQWDTWLAELGGHPLQSLLWGKARQLVDGIAYRCLAAFDQAGAVKALARVEARQVPVLGALAWIPKGPVAVSGFDPWPGLEQCCRALGYLGWAASPWEEVPATAISASGPRTIWLDLTRGRDALLQDLDAQWRYGARRALREGVVVSTTVAVEQVRRFHALCQAISVRKGFELPGSEALMLQLLQASQTDAPVEARLFIATLDGVIAGGAFVLRAGSHLHYLWGAVDRACSRARAGEALQWAVIEWGLGRNCTRYDLEGIDPLSNPGTYQFKKKMGGTEIQLQPQIERALDWRGALVLQALQLKRRLAGSAAPKPQSGD